MTSVAKFHRSTLLLSLLTALPMLAHAANSPIVASTSTSISNLTFQLVDLTPDDGIAPSASFDVGGVLGEYVFAADGSLNFQGTAYSGSVLPASTVTYVSADGSTTVTASPSGISSQSQITLAQLLARPQQQTDTLKPPLPVSLPLVHRAPRFLLWATHSQPSRLRPIHRWSSMATRP